jgi:hypothetical protein
MPRAGPSRSQRQPSQTQSQLYGRSEEEEVVDQNYDDEEELGLDEPDGGTVRAVR